MLQWEEKPAFFSTTWEKANNYAKCLGDGWRLPTRSELLQAYDSGVPHFELQCYWSSSEIGDQVWYVEFADGYSGRCYSKLDNYYVRCVRDIPEETVREPLLEIRDCLQVQEKSALLDDYNLGLYNGMEFCLTILEKREPKYKNMESKKPIIPRYRIDVIQNPDKEIKGMKYELEESGNWIQYNDVRNIIDNHEYLLFELKKLLRDVK